MKDMTSCPPSLTSGLATSPVTSNGDAPAPCLGIPAAKAATNGFRNADFPPRLETSAINSPSTKKTPSISRTSSSSSLDLTFQLDMDDESDSTPTKRTNDSTKLNGTDDLESTHDPHTSDVSTAESNGISACDDSPKDCLTVHSHKEFDESIVKTVHCLESNSLDTVGNETNIEGAQSSLSKSVDGSRKGCVDEGLEADEKVKSNIPDVPLEKDAQQTPNLSGGDKSQALNNEPSGDEVLSTDIGSNDGVVPKTEPTSAVEEMENVSIVTASDEICKDADTSNARISTGEQMPSGSACPKATTDGTASSKPLPMVSKDCIVTNNTDKVDLAPNIKVESEKLTLNISKECSPNRVQEEPPASNKNGTDQSSKSTELKILPKSENNCSSVNKDVEPLNPVMKETKESNHADESKETCKNSDLDGLKSCVLGKEIHNGPTQIEDEHVIERTLNEVEDGSICQESTTVSETEKPKGFLELKQDCKGLHVQSEPCEKAETRTIKIESCSSDGSTSESSPVLVTSVLKEKSTDINDNDSKSPMQIVQKGVLESKEIKCDLILEVAVPDVNKTGKLCATQPEEDSLAVDDAKSFVEMDEQACVPGTESAFETSTKDRRSSDEEPLQIVDLVTSDDDSAEECKVNGMTALLNDNKCEILESINDSTVEPNKEEAGKEGVKLNIVKVEGPVAEALCSGTGDVGLTEVTEEIKRLGNSGSLKEIPDESKNGETKVPPVNSSDTFPVCESSKSEPNEEKNLIIDAGAENNTLPNLSSASTSGDSLPQVLDTAPDPIKDTESQDDTDNKNDNSDLPPKSEINRTSESICTDIGEVSTKNDENTMETDDKNVQQSQLDAEILVKENGGPTAEQRASNTCSDEGNDGILISSDNDDSMGLSGVGQKRTSSHTNQIDAKKAKLVNGHDSGSSNSGSSNNGDNSINNVEKFDRGHADEKKAPVKRPLESSDSVETKKVRTSDISLSTEQVSKILSDEASSQVKSTITSSLLPKPLSNIDKAIERVAFAGLDKKERLLMPLLRDLKNRNLVTLTKDDLDELVSQRLCELLTECGDLFTREKVQKLEQSVEHWKQKAASLQKQITDMTMVFKKLATETKQHPHEMQIPIKITRSVGLQVVMPSLQAAGKNASPQLKNGLVQGSKRKNGGLITNRNTPHTIQYPTNTSTMTPNRPPLVQKVVTPPSGAPSPMKPPQVVSKPQMLGPHSSPVRFRHPNGGVATGTSTSMALVTTTATGVRNIMQPRPVVKSVMVPRPAEDRVIDLTDEDDKTKRVASNTVVQTMRLTNLNTSTPTASNTIRIVSPQQLTGPAPGVAGVNGQRLTYMLPASAGNPATGRLQLFTQPGGNLVAVSRPNHIPTLMLKSATVMSPANSVPGNVIRTPGANVVAGQFQNVPRGRPTTIRVTNGGAPRPITSVVTAPLTQHAIRSEHHVVRVGQHPAPLPPPQQEFPSNPSWKKPPPRPDLKISKVDTKDQHGIILSWNMDHGTEHEDIASYQLYAYQENNSPPSTSQWKKVGDVKAMPLPMACTLTQFLEGNKYHFAVRAIDIHSRCGSFSIPGHIILPVRPT